MIVKQKNMGSNCYADIFTDYQWSGDNNNNDDAQIFYFLF